MLQGLGAARLAALGRFVRNSEGSSTLELGAELGRWVWSLVAQGFAY